MGTLRSTCMTAWFSGNCSAHFYQCARVNGELVAHDMYCGAGLIFDARYSVCNYPHDIPVSAYVLAVVVTGEGGAPGY